MKRSARSFKLVVAKGEVAPHKLSELSAACRRAGVELSLCVRDALSSEQADALVGVVRTGQQRIPAEYLEYVEKCAPEASLLLFCEQALAQPFVSLSDGRVTLLGPDADEDSVYCRLRVLLAERGVATASGVERAGPAFWFGDSRATVSASVDEEVGSLTLAFPLPSDACSPAEHSEASKRALDAQASLRAAMSGKLTPDVGVLHFAPSLQEWLLCWPAQPNSLWLLSPLRLPVVSDLSLDHGGRGATRLRAASGDVALVVCGQLDGELAMNLARRLTKRVSYGGPAVFDEASRAIANTDSAWVSVVEVR